MEMGPSSICLLAFYVSIAICQPVNNNNHAATFPAQNRETSETVGVLSERDNIPKVTTKISFVTKNPPPCAKGKDFCEEVDDYPREYLDSLISKNFGELSLLFHTYEGPEETAISQKIGDPTTETSLCPSKVDTHHFRKAMTINNEWKFVVNHGNYTQHVRMETCLKEDKSDCGRLHLDPYKTSCIQKHIYLQLVSLDKDGKLSRDTFNIPSCCSCVMMLKEYSSTSVPKPLSL